MTTYLQVVNNVLVLMRWDPITELSFAEPPKPADAVKLFVNQAKDEVLSLIMYPLVEREFSIFTRPTLQSDAVGSMAYQGPGINTWLTTVSLDQTLDVRRKLIGEELAVDGIEASNFDASWVRVASVPTTNTFTTPTAYNTDFNLTPGKWSLFQDEYDLDPIAREITTMWSGQPLALLFQDEPTQGDRRFAGQYIEGNPIEAMIYSSPYSGQVNQVQIRPVPVAQTQITYKSNCAIADYVAFDDIIELEAEVVKMIERKALQLALGSPIQNDPDLALTVESQTNAHIDQWRQAQTPRDAARRIRRETPGEGFVRRRIGRVTLDTR